MAQVSNTENNNFTKECIYVALWDLLEHHPYESITITQIAQKAGVSRNAIYRNFDSKDMIITKRLHETFNNFIEKSKRIKYSSHEEYIFGVFQHLCDKKDIAQTLIKANLSEFILQAFLYVKGNYKTNIQNDFYENYRIGGTLFVYLTWLLTGCNETAQQLADIVNHICQNPAILPNFST